MRTRSSKNEIDVTSLMKLINLITQNHLEEADQFVDSFASLSHGELSDFVKQIKKN